MRNIIIIAATVAASLISATSAVAGDNGSGNPVETIRFDDLDLRTADGTAQLNRRIARATEAVCGSYAHKDNVEQDAVTDCRQKVRSGIAPQLAKALNSAETELARK